MNEWLNAPVQEASNLHVKKAKQRQDSLTKPAGSLGRMEALAIRLAALQATERPAVERVTIAIFAADHGVAAAGVSAFPQEVTGQMVANFSAGGAAISVLAKSLDAQLEVINVGTLHDPGPLPGVRDCRIAAGTANFQQQDAMTEQQLAAALLAGRESVERANTAGTQLYIGGEMGIGNTTSAAAIAAELLMMEPEMVVGPGTGLDQEGISKKTEVIRQALSRYQQLDKKPLELLRCVGGFEIAALTGAYIAAAQQGLPILVDGYICSVAALIAVNLQPKIKPWLFYAHRSAEPGHRYVLASLDAQPLFDFGMRLGEGSGAATAVPLLRLACDLHNNMATFAEAGVSDQ
ncbi:MAG: nicotinate-nucleotide--dimethylbenzimidazole phosphoribosyltransferase [Candidatus Polarisedimenticolaceae bacterium]|nr:nicotinate-nucleotide--dimethylbenzimidazole phosphoribosyltransferase [Candidatus Polarisedimenticolaceae bacterium]